VSALVRDGAAFCWGNVTTGAQSNDVLVGSPAGLPASFGPPGPGVTTISARSYNGCLVQRGWAYCWVGTNMVSWETTAR